jgi:hypothetical protein
MHGRLDDWFGPEGLQVCGAQRHLGRGPRESGPIWSGRGLRAGPYLGGDDAVGEAWAGRSLVVMVRTRDQPLLVGKAARRVPF